MSNGKTACSCSPKIGVPKNILGAYHHFMNPTSKNTHVAKDSKTPPNGIFLEPAPKYFLDSLN
jgi:hypothetical protein